MKIKIKYHNSNCKLENCEKGEWIDCKASETIALQGPRNTAKKGVVFDNKLMPLGFSMELPKGFEAHLIARSSLFNNTGTILANAQGIIDSSYCGEGDEWKANLIAFRPYTILEGRKICQFKIVLSQKASIWVKLRWLFTSKIEFIEVKHLSNKDRGGFGSTGF